MPSVHFSSATNEWSTPQAFFDKLDSEFHFDLDPCATFENAKCERYYTLVDDGLDQDWTGTVFMNPPYGREIGRWVAKASQESQKGATVVCLIPARTDTSYWHDYIERKAEVRFIRGRLRFGGSKWNAPFPSAIVVFRPNITGSATDITLTCTELVWPGPRKCDLPYPHNHLKPPVEDTTDETS